MIVNQHALGRNGYEVHQAGSAVFSPCDRYRYLLTRAWGYGEGALNVIGLNCSTATATEDDPTIRRCIGYAKRWGFARLFMTNVFAFRATDPRVMRAQADPNGPRNDEHLQLYATAAQKVLAAWGGYAVHQAGEARVLQLLAGVPVYSLGLTKDGHPRHPLYLRADLEPERWR